MNYKHPLSLILFFLSFISCINTNSEVFNDNSQNDLIIKSDVLNSSFKGNGVQWGGYDLIESWTGNTTLSENDWTKLFKRVRFMQPPLMRIMVTAGWNYSIDNQYIPTKSDPVLCKILSFCQEEGITVIIGEWGHTGGKSIDQAWLENSVRFFDWLINTKGFSCIRYFNMVNEPNGDWSSTKGDYALWKTLINQFHAKLVEKGLDSKITIIGPDVAVWNTGLTSWINNATADLAGKIGTYDIHTYPNESEVRDGTYSKMVKAYRDEVPASKEILMTELGFKYAATSILGKQNLQRIAADKYASDDSNMFVYDAFYGIDMADAMIQNMLAGYGGNILWDLDDAMYNVGGAGSTKLKRWGFWNILGTEKFENPSDENIRPWFYTASLLSRYFPRGSKIYSMSLPNKYGLRAVAGEIKGKYSIAIVNSHTVSYSVDLKMENGKELKDLRVYNYQSGVGKNFTGKIDQDGFAQPESTSQTFNLANGAANVLAIPAKSFCLITNID